MEGKEVLFLSGFFGIIAVVIFGSGRRNTAGSPFRWARGPVAIGFLLLALAVLTAACGSSSDGDAAPGAGSGTTVSSGISAVPPAPTGTSQEVAKQELDILIQLSQGEFTLDRQEMAAYSEQVGAVLDRIDSDPEVLESFKNLLADMLGVTFVFEDATGLNSEPPGKVGRASPIFGPQRTSIGPFRCASADPNDPYPGSKAWLFLRCFMDALFDATEKASPVFIADPIYATEVPKLAVRMRISDRCINDIERCVRGDDPVLNKFRQGDFVGAHKIVRELASKRQITSGPTETPTREPKAILPQTATRAPTETLPPSTTTAPTEIPTVTAALAPIAVSDFSGTWVGRYSGLYTHGFPICGSTIPIEGSLTVVLTQTGTQVTGTAILGGVDVLEIVQDADGNCSIVKAADEVTMIAASVSGDTLSSAPGLPVTFTMTKTSENSAEGTTKTPYLDATFFLGRLR